MKKRDYKLSESFNDMEAGGFSKHPIIIGITIPGVDYKFLPENMSKTEGVQYWVNGMADKDGKFSTAIDGRIEYVDGFDSTIYVKPVLKLSMSEEEKEYFAKEHQNRFLFGEHPFNITDDGRFAICQTFLGQRKFMTQDDCEYDWNTYSSHYDDSDLKVYLDRWLDWVSEDDNTVSSDEVITVDVKLKDFISHREKSYRSRDTVENDSVMEILDSTDELVTYSSDDVDVFSHYYFNEKVKEQLSNSPYFQQWLTDNNLTMDIIEKICTKSNGGEDVVEESSLEEIKNAWSQAVIYGLETGAADDAYNKLVDAIKSAIEDSELCTNVSFDKFGDESIGHPITITASKKQLQDMYSEAEEPDYVYDQDIDFENDSIADIIEKNGGYHFKLYYPQYGWDGYSEDAATDVFYNELPENVDLIDVDADTQLEQDEPELDDDIDQEDELDD